MKKIVLTLLLLILAVCPVLAEVTKPSSELTKFLCDCDGTKHRKGAVHAEEHIVPATGFKGLVIGSVKEFTIYRDKESKENNYAPSGWMGDRGDIKIEEGFMVNPHSGSTSIQFNYSAKKSQSQGWAGVYWQNPADNWGSKIGGFNLTGMTKLTFWAKGAKGGEVIQRFMVGGIKGVYPDSTLVEYGPVELTNTWKKYAINLAGKDLSYINGGFGWVAKAGQNVKGLTFYLDDIKFEVDHSMDIDAKDMPFYIYADKDSVNNHFVASGWMGGYTDLMYDGASIENPYAGSTCIKIIYYSCDYQIERWAGIYWQHPADNWGNIDAGYDLSNATKLTFWAKGVNGDEYITEFKVGGISGRFGDSDIAIIGPVILNKEWTQYTIDLTGKDMSRIIGGFCWLMSVQREGAAFYLDEIKFE